MVRIHPDPPPNRSTGGAIAQLGERLLCKQEVIGSIPIGSTSIAIHRGNSSEARVRASLVLPRSIDRLLFNNLGLKVKLFSSRGVRSVCTCERWRLTGLCIASCLTGLTAGGCTNLSVRVTCSVVMPWGTLPCGALRSKGARQQGYRVKRISACGGCLGNDRRRRT